MKQKDKRISELTHWVLEDARRQNIPFIMNHAIQRYKVTEKTSRSYAIAIMVKLGKLSQPMKVSDIYRMWLKDRSSPSHYPKLPKASEI